MSEEVRRLGRQYDGNYFENYGRGPHQYQGPAPYRLEEPLWQSYFGHIADLVVTELAPATVLDAGCAIGFLVKELRARGVEAWGIDISEYAIEHVDETVRKFCSVASITDDLERSYDLIVCLEVLEHLPAEVAPMVVANFGCHTNAVLFSASADGFRDPTHVNVQPTDYWIELFGRHGFFRDLDVDAGVASPQAIYFVRAGQTAVSVARAYERWHTRTLAELRDLRRAREDVRSEFVRAERASAEASALRGQVEHLLAERGHSVWAETDGSELLAQLEYYKAAAARAETELSLIRQTRTFRYTAPVRSIYAWLRHSQPRTPSFGYAAPSNPERSQPGISYGIDAPRAGELVGPDLIVGVRGWAICDRAPVARVEISVSGTGCCKARLGLSRPDVAERFERADASISGFEALLDLAEVPLEDERTSIEVSVVTRDGHRYQLEPVDVRLPAHLETPATTGTLTHATRRRASADELRLLVFTHHLGFGGGQLYLFELLRLLAQSPNFNATLVAPEDGPLRQETEALGIPVVVNGHHPVGSIERYETRLAEVAKWARGQGYNAILANTFGAFPGVDLAERIRIPAVWAIHESFRPRSFWHVAYGSSAAIHPLVRSRAETALASAAAVVFEANATRDLFVDHGEASRFVTVPYGINIAEIDRYATRVSQADARRHLKLPADATVLLCLGTIEPRKAQAPLTQAFASVAEERPEALLVLVGARADESSKALDSFVRKSGFASRVRIVPTTPEIYPWYRAADALVCASDVESMPRTVLEAMAFSVPVMATRVFGLPELIDDGSTGYLCEPADIGELELMLNRFLRASAEERYAIATAGASLVRQRHDSRGYATAYDRLLRGLVKDSARIPSEILTES